MAARKPALRKLTVYSKARAELITFEKKYEAIVVDCSTPKGMTSAKDCRKEIRDARSNLEDLRKETKVPIIDKGRQVDEEAKTIKDKLDKLFSKFDGAIKAIENAKEIAQQKELDDALTKVKDLEDREAAIIAKEIELGLREPEEESTNDTASSSDDDNSSEPVTNSVDEGSVDVGGVLAQPHIDLANERLEALRAIRDLIKPTDAQPNSGDIDEAIAVQHDQVLAEVWDIVDALC